MSITTDFSAAMDRIVTFIELNVAAFDLAKPELTKLRSNHAVAVAAKEVHHKARAIPMGLSLACEGAYLSACAQFEQCVRDLIEEAALQTAAKLATFAQLPRQMQEEHTNGCAKILQNLTQDRYQHLSHSTIVSALYACMVSGANPMSLIVEAFSSNDRNFKPEIVSQHVNRLGISKVWKLMGQEPSLQAFFSGALPTDTQRYAYAKLEGIMDARNAIIHRGKTFAAPTDSEAKECAKFFAALTNALSGVLHTHVASL